MIKKLPVGISDFEELIRDNYYFVDKSLLIKELLDTGAKVTLIPRPRRFGKTLNMSMLQCFFEKSDKAKRYLFKGLKIEQDENCMAHQGLYPVISMTFKDIKKRSWEDCYKKLIDVISKEFKRHSYLLTGLVLDSDEKRDYRSIISKKADTVQYESALEDLSAFLARYHNKKPIILIDEYDAPVHAGVINGYYEDIINFMRGFLGGGLKDNSSLEFGVITGILRVARESIFSGINNLRVCSFLHSAYSDKFGLLEHEVRDLVTSFGMIFSLDDIKEWYNGYSSGDDFMVYNPWSIINFVDNKGKLQPYWINTSDNAIIQKIIEKDSGELRTDLEFLLTGGVIKKNIDDNIVFEEIFPDHSKSFSSITDTEPIWSFLLFCGYLSCNKSFAESDKVSPSAFLCIPNKEVALFYQKTIFSWFKKGVDIRKYTEMLNALTCGNVALFKKIFYQVVLQSFSYFDVAGHEPEKFYHGFVLGMLVSLCETHKVASNRESGYGRYDVLIIPKNKQMHGIIIEFKTLDEDEENSLEKTADAALKQIKDKQYDAQLKAEDITNIITLGIAFKGKNVLIKEA